MVIVAGHITVEPQQRESYLAGCVRIVEHARPAVGCPDVAICADLADPGRVQIFERWASRAALETFCSSGPDTNSARRCSRCPFRSTTSPTCGPCSGRMQDEWPDRPCCDR
jgi:quinol monooxygenase YgiN